MVKETGKNIMVIMAKTLGLCLFLLMASVSCEPLEDISEVPSITFKDFELFQIDTFSNTIYAGRLTFDFVDGDADIGINQDFQGVYDSINFFLLPSEKSGETYLPLADTLKYQIRYNEKLDRIGQNKTIKGEIALVIYYFITPPYDTIRYDFFILDRAMHQSNIATTTDIGFR